MSLGSITRWILHKPKIWEGVLSRVRVHGSGRDVVVLHGLASSHECWDSLGFRLGAGHRLHRVQLRGFAGEAPPTARQSGGYLKSVADELAGYIRKQTRGSVALVGHSMGGIVSLILARDHADVVDRVMVVDVPSFFSVLINPFATEATFAAFAEATRQQYLGRDKPALEQDLRRTSRQLVQADDHFEEIVRWGIESDQRLTADVMAEVMTTDLRKDIASIDVPIEVLYAWDRDTTTPRVALDHLYASAYAGLKRGNRRRIDNARHYVMLDKPDVFAEAVFEWLGQASETSRKT